MVRSEAALKTESLQTSLDSESSLALVGQCVSRIHARRSLWEVLDTYRFCDRDFRRLPTHDFVLSFSRIIVVA